MIGRVRDWARQEPAAAVASAFAAVALASGVTAVATWGDGSPEPWIWISWVTAPIGIVAGIAASSRTAGKAALIVSLVVAVFWAVVVFELVTGPL